MTSTLTLSEAARLLSLPESAVRRQADRGELPHIRAGAKRFRLFARADLERIAAERRQQLLDRLERA